VTLGFLSSWYSFPLSFGFFKDADSNVAPPSYSAPQSAQVTRLSAVELSGTTNLLLPHLGHLSGAWRPAWRVPSILVSYC